jgi:hypothetical protein
MTAADSAAAIKVAVVEWAVVEVREVGVEIGSEWA